MMGQEVRRHFRRLVSCGSVCWHDRLQVVIPVILSIGVDDLPAKQVITHLGSVCNVWFHLSSNPFVIGWYAIDILLLIPIKLQSLSFTCKYVYFIRNWYIIKLCSRTENRIWKYIVWTAEIVFFSPKCPSTPFIAWHCWMMRRRYVLLVMTLRRFDPDTLDTCW